MFRNIGLRLVRIGPLHVEGVREVWNELVKAEKIHKPLERFALDYVLDNFIEKVIFVYLEDPSLFDPSLMKKEFIAQLNTGEMFREFKLFYDENLLGQIHISLTGGCVIEGNFTPVESWGVTDKEGREYIA